jgi:hypothetical protein
MSKEFLFRNYPELGRGKDMRLHVWRTAMMLSGIVFVL